MGSVAATAGRDDGAGRRLAYLRFLLRAADLWWEGDRAASALGLAPEELMEDGRRMWQRARAGGADTRRQVHEFVAQGEDPAVIEQSLGPVAPAVALDHAAGRGRRTADQRHLAWVWVPPPDSGVIGMDSAPFEEHAADEGFGLDCPVCGETVRLTVRALIERHRLVCPVGHELALHECAGLEQVIAFLGELVRVARRCPR